jgi:hypothetical protein
MNEAAWKWGDETISANDAKQPKDDGQSYLTVEDFFDE